jgi:N-acetylglutamate synthase-like GNAT family acetyltransferase
MINFVYQDRRGRRGHHGVVITLHDEVYERASVDLVCEDKGIEICNVRAHYPRGKGYGTIIMKHIVEEFGTNELFLVCEPRLEGFYKRFGFKQIITTTTTSPHSLPMLTMEYHEK